MSFRLQTTFPGITLPKNTPYMDQILASDSLVTYFQADAAKVAINSGGKITNWSSKKPSDTTALIASPDAIRPTLSASVFGGQYPAVTFDGSDDMTWTGDFSRSVAFSWMMIFKAAIPSSDGYLASTFTSVGVGTWLRMTAAGLLQFGHGTGVIGTKALSNGTTIVIGSSSADYIRGRANGVDMGVASTNNAGGTGTLDLGAADNVSGTLNSPIAVHVSDFAIWQRDILRDGALVSLLEGFARDVYDADVAA